MRAMKDAIAGAWAKVSRAEETIQEIENALSTLMASETKPFRVVGKHQNDYRAYVFTGYADGFPPKFSVLVGEVCHHLRSSLDHVTWALALRTSDTPKPRLQFPICETQRAFEDAVKRGQVDGVGTDAMAIIENLQPFRMGDPSKATLLALHYVNNLDKHRLLVVVATSAWIGKEIRFVPADGDFAPRETPIELVGMSPPFSVVLTKDGADIFAINFGSPTPEVKVLPELNTMVCFESFGGVQLPLVQGLRHFSRAVKDTLNSFEPLF